MQMSKDEFVETIMRMARDERINAENAAREDKERKRKLEVDLKDYVYTIRRQKLRNMHLRGPYR